MRDRPDLALPSRRAVTAGSAAAVAVAASGAAGLGPVPGRAARGASGPVAPEGETGGLPLPRMQLARGEDRALMQANGARGWFQGRSCAQPHADWYAGWTVARRRVLADWRLVVEGREPLRAEADVTVAATHLERSWPQLGLVERAMLVPGLDVLLVEVEAPEGVRIEVAPVGLDPVVPPRPGVFAARDPEAGVVRCHQLEPVPVGEGRQRVRVVFEQAASVAGLSAPGALSLPSAPVAARAAQLAPMVSIAGDSDTGRALAWLQLCGGQLVARQQGQGIYAGLPWFDDYWGRDTFISFIGLLLVPGRFAEARAVLTDFAAQQDSTPGSPTFGRVPNRARPDEVIYNTADGTPRFVASIADYVDWSGDATIVPELWPAVRRALEGALAHSVDGEGLMVHADADTWMDAKEAGTRPFTPRGTRANDIQALWLRQLTVTGRFARQLGHTQIARQCARLEPQVRAAFARRFLDPAGGRMADRIAADGTPDFTLRPNLLFALDLVDDPALRRQLVEQVARRLVVPWGVMSLDPEDPGFHPVHEAPELWHKDFAYHTGTVWLWLNGEMIGQLVREGHVGQAWTLFARMLRQALEEGAVGCLSELRDAMPRGGEAEGRLSGTFAQAWSHAEALRVFVTAFCGVRAMDARRLDLAPSLPPEAAGWRHLVRHQDWTVELAQTADAPEQLAVRLLKGRSLRIVAHGATVTGRLVQGRQLLIPTRGAAADKPPALEFAPVRPAETFPVWRQAAAGRSP
jgi:glycogen debranching enzyme